MTDKGDGSVVSSRRSVSPTNKTTTRVSSPVLPLAPLEYLQNQRRGSITDPSLHAAPSNMALKQFRQLEIASSSTDGRPASPYVFGEASSHNSENSPQIRNLVHNTDSEASKLKDAMNVDKDGEFATRHSIAGTKRKMSSDEVETPLVGPGVPSIEDSEGPSPKRRGSAFDTQRIAQLSLNDRRHSVDSRSSTWWHPSALSGTESPHAGRPSGIATFAWPSNPHPPDMHNQLDRFDSSTLAMMPPMNFNPERRMSVPDPLTTNPPTRVLRSRSRPPSRNIENPSTPEEDSAPPPKQPKESSSTPYSRSPELRVSHKLAERKRRKEMKELFDELRDQLPADRGMKASKWEILSKAIDFVQHLKQSNQDLAREIEVLRHELEIVRQGGIPAFPPGTHPHVVYSQAPPVPGQYPIPQAGAVPPPPPPPLSRPASSQNAFPPSQNGNNSRADVPP